MDKTKKKRIRRIISLICIAAVVILLAVMPLLASENKTESGPQASILSGTAGTGDIETKVIGGGTLAQEDGVEITVPSAVKLTGFLVADGDAVSQGDPIAAVDRVTVMTAIAQVQETLDHLTDEISDAGEEETGDKVKAQAGGTVKIIYAKEGESVQEVMLRDGALAVISLDGLMEVQLQTEAALEVGSTVTVTLSDGDTAKGSVESNLKGTMVVTVTDDGYTPGEAVEVSDGDGNALGTGTLAIHSPWNATAYAGIIDDIKVTKEKAVDAGDTLFTLSDTGNTAAYQQLMSQRAKYEELMLELFTMYQTQQLTAPCDGVVSGIDEDSLQLLCAGAADYSLTLLANAPNGDDGTLYTNYVGQVLAVGSNGWSVKLDPQGVEIADYKVLSGVQVDTATMTELVLHTQTQVPVYELSGDAWVQADSVTVTAGDTLLFAADPEGSFVWIVRLQKAAAEEPDTTDPATPTQPGGSSGGSTGGMSGYPQGGVTQEETFELYGLETSTVATVTPQDTMTLEITVDELDITRLYVGQQANIAVDALNGQTVTGTVTDIGNTGTNNGGSSKFTVELTMDRTENMLAGMNATAKLLVDTAQDVLLIPAAALALDGAKTVVYTGYDEKNETLTGPVTVTVGRSDGESVEILEGLQQGQTYYYAYYDTLEISYSPEFGGFSFR